MNNLAVVDSLRIVISHLWEESKEKGENQRKTVELFLM